MLEKLIPRSVLCSFLATCPEDIEVMRTKGKEFSVRRLILFVCCLLLSLIGLCTGVWLAGGVHQDASNRTVVGTRASRRNIQAAASERRAGLGFRGAHRAARDATSAHASPQYRLENHVKKKTILVCFLLIAFVFQVFFQAAGRAIDEGGAIDARRGGCN